MYNNNNSNNMTFYACAVGNNENNDVCVWTNLRYFKAYKYKYPLGLEMCCSLYYFYVIVISI